VKETGAERRAKGFSCWQQFVAMLFCHLGRANFLREICGGLSSIFGKIRHLGINKALKHSTLSYANNHRPWQLYEKVFYQFLGKCQSIVIGKKKFRFKNRLFSLDATVIELRATLFDWAKYRQTKGTVKLHLLLDHEGYLPVFAHVTEGKVHEVRIARGLKFPRGSIVVVDRGYTDYSLYRQWTEEEVYFVTRQKGNADYRVVEERDIPSRGNILRDQVIKFRGFYARKDYPYRLRRPEVWDDANERVIVLLTNHFEFGPTTIAAIYKDRWQIEIFFKVLMQNLKIRSFVGTTKNAVVTQIWTALIAILVLKYL
jgi:hypothetical protein